MAAVDTTAIRAGMVVSLADASLASAGASAPKIFGLVESVNTTTDVITLQEALTEVPSLKDEELDVIGELISNMYGALEVHKMVKDGTPQKEALNSFMKRVLGSIDS